MKVKTYLLNHLAILINGFTNPIETSVVDICKSEVKRAGKPQKLKRSNPKYQIKIPIKKPGESNSDRCFATAYVLLRNGSSFISLPCYSQSRATGAKYSRILKIVWFFCCLESGCCSVDSSLCRQGWWCGLHFEELLFYPA